MSGAMHLWWGDSLVHCIFCPLYFWWDTSFVWWIFRMYVVRFYSKAMYRQIGEGCLIQSSEAELLMNGKLDHFAPVVGRMVASTAVQSGRRRVRNTGWARVVFFFCKITHTIWHTHKKFCFCCSENFLLKIFCFIASFCVILIYHFHFSLHYCNRLDDCFIALLVKASKPTFTFLFWTLSNAFWYFASATRTQEVDSSNWKK